MRSRPVSGFVLLVLCLAAVAIVMRFGLLPPKYTPLPALVVERPLPILVDWQLDELRRDAALCRGLLSTRHVTAATVPDRLLQEGCGWSNAVRLSRVGGARVQAAQVNCGVVGALAVWMVNVVQPEARRIFERDVVAVKQMGVYSCRNIVGSALWKDRRSEHATANAIDISGFTLQDGLEISVLTDWSKPGPKGRFLRAVHEGACRYFRVVLGPEFNAAHRDHFHFDRGPLWRCK
ncbi:MAG: extensin family protein [Hyphomicrobiaceae bacterium]